MKKISPVIASMAFLGLAAGRALPADNVEHGKEVYAAGKCAMCHSITGKGNAKNSLDGVGAKLKAAEIRKWIRAPKEMKGDSK